MDFRFKRFGISQSRSAMKVGTDGVLLGAWFRIPENGDKILDIGTGTGLIALMAAQRSERHKNLVIGIEPDEGSYLDAADNAAASTWKARISIQKISLRDYVTSGSSNEAFGAIVSNPPYFTDSLLPSESSRSAARHTVNLTHCELVESVMLLLGRGGTFSVIIPYIQTTEFVKLCGNSGLYPIRNTAVITRRGSGAVRSMIEFVKGSEENLLPVYESEIVIEEGPRHNYSKEYKKLTNDFYLRF